MQSRVLGLVELLVFTGCVTGCVTGGLPGSTGTPTLGASGVDDTAAREELLKCDRDFSALSAQQGFPAAVSAFFTDDATSLMANEMPLIGKTAILANLNASPFPGFLTWEPRRAEASGDLGYTWGDYKLQSRSEGGQAKMRTGKYVSIWKRQPDKSWKVIVDTGNSNPEAQGNIQ